MVAREYPAQRKKYLLRFTAYNIGLLAVLLLAGWVLALTTDFWGGLF